MFSVEQTYSRLFRPWDVSENKTNGTFTCDMKTKKLNDETKQKRKMRNEESKRENRLRKIRGHYRKPDPGLHQDATVSTTTSDVGELNPDVTISKVDNIPKDSPVANLSLCCDRLLREPSERTKITKADEVKHEPKELKASSPVSENQFLGNMISTPVLGHPAGVYSNVPQAYLPEFLPTADIAQALGVPPTDPLLLESLAQGYAMELEYARILQQENETKLLNARKQRPKKYKCPHCQVGFSNNGQLKGHIRIHTGERPFKCDEKNCGKTFTRNEELTRHKRIHSGVRPYPCQTCGKKFGRRDHLKKHTKTHYIQAERMMPVFVPLSAMPHVTAYPYLYGY